MNYTPQPTINISLKLSINFFSSIFWVCILFTNTMALQPEIVSPGWLLLKAEYGTGQTYTGYAAVVGGVETWLTKYGLDINTFCYGREKYNYWTTLPYYGYTQVTAEKLANLIWYDNSLGLSNVPADIIIVIQSALQADHDATQKPKASTDYWDPIDDWAWRSIFMEGRLAENGSTVKINSNCWGNADYLTRSNKWVEAYPTSKQNAFLLPGMSEWGASFPHIYLNGWIKNNAYSIDGDLQSNSWRFTLVGTGNVSGGLKNILTSFDIIRMSSLTYAGNPYELVWEGSRLGINQHCAVYLCTDYSGKPWFFEKANFGATSGAPYRIRAFGVDPNAPFEGSFRSYFRHNGNYKLNLQAGSEINWAGITP